MAAIHFAPRAAPTNGENPAETNAEIRKQITVKHTPDGEATDWRAGPVATFLVVTATVSLPAEVKCRASETRATARIIQMEIDISFEAAAE